MIARVQLAKRVLLSFVAGCVILVATFAALVESNAGSRFALSVISLFIPLEYTAPRGDLLNGLDVDRMRYRNDDVYVEVVNTSFRWEPASILLGTLHVNSLSAESVLIRVLRVNDEETNERFDRWPNLRLPLRVELEKMSIDKIVFVQGEGEPIFWEKLAGSFSLGTFHLRYRDLALEHLDYGIKATGSTLIEYPYTTDALVDFRIGQRDPSAPNSAVFPYIGRASVNGGINQLELKAITVSPVAVQLEARSSLVDQRKRLKSAPSIDLVAQWQNQKLPDAWWVPNQPTPITSAKLTAKGNWKKYSAKLLGNLQLENYPETHVDIDLNGTLKGATINQFVITDDKIALPLTLDPIAVRPTKVPFGAAVSQSLPLPFPVKKPKAPEVALIAPQENPLAQRLAINGSIEWLPRLKWDLASTAKNINFATYFAELKSDLKFEFLTQGEFDYETRAWQFNLNDLQAEGILRDRNLTAKGGLLAAPTHWESPGLDISYGANTAKIRGKISENSQFEWQITAPELAQVWDGFSGSVITRGQLLVDQAQPRMAMTLTADNFTFGNYRAEELLFYLHPKNISAAPTSDIVAPTDTSVALRQDLTKESVENPITELRNEISKAFWSEELLKRDDYLLDVKGKNLVMFGLPMNRVDIRGDGGLLQHSFTAKFDGPVSGQTEFGLKGVFKQSVWTGKFDSVDIRLPKVPRWWLASSEDILVSAKEIVINAQCLTTRGQIQRRDGAPQIVTTLTGDSDGDTLSTSGQSSFTSAPSDARLCVKGRIDEKSGLSFTGDLEKAPIRQLYAAFNPDVSLSGTLGGSFKLNSPAPISLANLSGEIRLGADGASVNYQYAGGEIKQYFWERSGLIATLDKQQLDARGQINWTDFGALRFAMKADVGTSAIKEGNIAMNFSNIAPLETFFVNVNDLVGSLNGSIAIKGKLNAPEMSGQINLRDGGASLLSLGITPKNINLTVNVLDNDSVAITGQATSNKGQLAVDAQLRQLSGETWQASGTIRGDDFRILNTPQLRLHVSPNLFVGASRDAITIRGSTLIPYGRANIKTLPESSVKVSDDVVIVDTQNLAQEKKVPWPVELNVELNVGKDVKFNGFGLNSTLAGSVVLFKEKDWTRPLLNGFVSVVKGTYKAYGQSLNVDRGRLIFQGSYENPGLDILASREVSGDDSTKVGLEITGTLQRPAAKVYSTPAMSDSESMMMLLTGRPIKDASNAEATLLLGALTGLTGGGDGFTGNIAERLNLDEFGFNANNGIEQSELWVGKYLTPKLLVRYVVGLFDQLVSLGVEYQINEKLRLEARSGDEQSVDLIYKYER